MERKNRKKKDEPPLAEVKDAQGEPLVVAIEIAGRQVHIKVWKVDVGRIQLYLLDTNIAGNSAEDRLITSHLYGGDSEIRNAQGFYRHVL